MPHTLTINMAGQINTAQIAGCGPGAPSAADQGDLQTGAEQLEMQKTQLSQTCQTLRALVDKLNQLHDKILSEHKEEIAKLSVEIARKILVQKVREGDYEIEAIVKEAIGNAPTRQDMVVHLNPEDLVQCQQALQKDEASDLTGIEFVSDPGINRAECRLETGKGIVESMIDQQLEQIGKALEKAH